MKGDRPPSHKRWIGAYYLRIGWIDGAARASQSLEQRVEGLSLLRLSRVVTEQGEANLFGLCRAQETQGNKPNISDCRSRNSPAAFDKGKNWYAAFQTRIWKNCQTKKSVQLSFGPKATWMEMYFDIENMPVLATGIAKIMQAGLDCFPVPDKRKRISPVQFP